MNELFKKVIQFLGILFAALVIGFTGYQTYSLLAEVSGNALIAWLGLALFEGGMLYWWFVFQKEAEGIGQLALSLLLFVFGLALVAGSTGLHLGAIDAAALGENTPAKLVTIAAIINLIGKTLYPIFSPKTFGHIWERALEGVVMAKAYAAAQGKADDMAEQLADNVGNEIVRRLTVAVLTNHQLRHEAEKNPPALPLLRAKTTVDATPNQPEEREVTAFTGSPSPALRTRPQPQTEPLEDYPDTEPVAPPVRQTWVLDDLLKRMKMTREQARLTAKRYGLNTAPEAWATLKNFGYIPDGMSADVFTRLYNELMTPVNGAEKDSPLTEAAQ